MSGAMLWAVLCAGGGILAVLLYPLFRPREPWDLNETPDRLRHLKRSRDRFLRTLKDLEVDFQEGSLEEEDYRELRSFYKDQAIGVSKELHRVREVVVRQISAGPGKPLATNERQRLESLIAGRKKKYGSR